MPDATEKKSTLYCSFCSKSQYEVVKLIAGPNAFICDECVGLCLDIISTELTPSQKVSKEIRERQREEAMNRMVFIITEILHKEQNRYRPFVELQEQLVAYKAVEETRKDLGPQEVKQFPQPTSSPGSD